MSQYEMHSDIFEGPLEVLLGLIEKRKLLINDIALGTVTDEYLKYLEQHDDFPVEETAQFVLVGSTLLLIKSKSLLPVLAFTDEEQCSVEDLEIRLRLLDRTKVLAKELRERYGTQRAYGKRATRHVAKVVYAPDPHTTAETLAQSIQSVIARFPQVAPTLPEATVRKVVSIEHMMQQLTQRINAGMRVSFREAAGTSGHKVQVIVTFLAMLELVHQGVVRVEQASQHGDITMHVDQPSVPRYV